MLSQEIDKPGQNHVLHALACKREGWTFRAWDVDLYGTLHHTARRMVDAVARVVTQKHSLAEWCLTTQ